MMLSNRRRSALALMAVLSGPAVTAGAVDGVPPPSMLDTDMSASAPVGQCGAPSGQTGEQQGNNNGHKHHRRSPPPDGDSGGAPDGPPSGANNGHRPPPRDASAPRGLSSSACGVQ